MIVRRFGLLTMFATLATVAALSGTAGAQEDPRPEFVIASIGDSFGSGEGNPLQPGQHDDRGVLTGAPETWGPPTDPHAQQCHRSPLAHGGRAAELLQQRFPQFRIRFVHVACSGAKISAGLIGPYVGVEPEAGAPLKPQVTQLNEILGARRIDALIVNIGVNDIGFGDIVQWCVLFADLDCHRMSGLVEGTRDLLGRLPSRYEILQASIRGTDSGPQTSLPPPFLNAVPGRVYLVAYPDPTRDGQGVTCHRSGDDEPFRNLTRGELGWMQDEVLPDLNGSIAQAVENGAALGEPYTLVDTHVPESRTHGICAPQPYFLSNRQALRVQGADAFDLFGLNFSNGIAHPNAAGHSSVARHVADAIAPQLQAEFVQGTPTLAAGDVTATAIGLRWSVPSTQAIQRFELEIRDLGAGPQGAPQTVTLPAGARTFTHPVVGTFAYRVRACGPVDCSPFSLTQRLSNLGADALRVPENLRQLQPGPARPGRQLGPRQSIEVAWDAASPGYAYFELAYRPLRAAGDTPARTLRRADADRLRRAEQQLRRAGTVTLGDVASRRLALPAFATLRTIETGATLGSVLDPLEADEPYEVKVRACSTIACSPYTETVVMQPRMPAPGAAGVVLDERQLPVGPGRPFGLGLEVRPGGRGPAIRGLEVRLVGEEGEVGRVRLDGRTRRLGLFGRRDGAGPLSRQRTRALRTTTGRAGSRAAPLRSGPIALSLRGSRARTAGRSLEADLTLTLGDRFAGQVLTVEVAAVDARGRRQPFAPAGAILVRG